MSKQVSKASDLAETVELLALPVPQGADGSEFVVKITPPPFEAIIKLLKGAPPATQTTEGEEKPDAELLEAAVQRLEKEAREMIEAGATCEPPISFDGPQEGFLHWPKLHVRNRGAIVRAWTRLAGVGPTRADRMGSFRNDPAGGGAGAPGDGGVPAAEMAP